MRLTDLLGVSVVDAEGAELGIVHDIGPVQDGPGIGTFGAVLRVHWLLVGASATWSRLGIDRRTTHGPGLVKTVARIGARPWQVSSDLRGVLTGSASGVRATHLLRRRPQGSRPYAAARGLPRFVAAATNTWRVDAQTPESSTVTVAATLQGKGLIGAPCTGMVPMLLLVGRVTLRDLAHFVEQGEPSPRKRSRDINDLRGSA